ncbi:unnamed protein product [marine sediment metagenome]|uniref:Uncharacterized protein n=1 Tax=marine sediment metagenome TaxID=412755 RepID=X0T2X1_9ZZZZ
MLSKPRRESIGMANVVAIVRTSEYIGKPHIAYIYSIDVTYKLFE